MISGITYNNSKHSLVFDDGGFIFSNPDNSGFKLNYEVYNRILELAKSNKIKIPIACTAIFLMSMVCILKIKSIPTLIH